MMRKAYSEPVLSNVPRHGTWRGLEVREQGDAAVKMWQLRSRYRCKSCVLKCAGESVGAQPSIQRLSFECADAASQVFIAVAVVDVPCYEHRMCWELFLWTACT